jgi:hypothetical protein
MNMHRRAIDGTQPVVGARESVRFTNNLRIRCPASLPSAIDKAAAKNLMTSAEYVRRSVIDRLRSDGIDPSGLALQSEGAGS